jgi:hypothetical protein
MWWQVASAVLSSAAKTPLSAGSASTTLNSPFDASGFVVNFGDNARLDSRAGGAALPASPAIPGVDGGWLLWVPVALVAGFAIYFVARK